MLPLFPTCHIGYNCALQNVSYDKDTQFLASALCKATGITLGVTHLFALLWNAPYLLSVCFMPRRARPKNSCLSPGMSELVDAVQMPHEYLRTCSDLLKHMQMISRHPVLLKTCLIKQNPSSAFTIGNNACEDMPAAAICK